MAIWLMLCERQDQWEHWYFYEECYLLYYGAS